MFTDLLSHKSVAISFQSQSYLERTVRLQSSISRLDEEPQEVQSVLGQQETQGVLCCPQDPKACANERRCRKNLYKDRSIDPILHRMQLLANELGRTVIVQRFSAILQHNFSPIAGCFAASDFAKKSSWHFEASHFSSCAAERLGVGPLRVALLGSLSEDALAFAVARIRALNANRRL